MGELRGPGSAYPPPGFPRQFQQAPNPTPGAMSGFSGRSQTFTPSDDSTIKFVGGKPVLDYRKSQDGNAWQNYKEGGWKDAFTWKEQPSQQSAWRENPVKQ
eukprot:12890023-Prorocentrum_lima.AAC.1